MKTGKIHPLFTGYAAASVLLFLYSFTQVDLSLTLTRVSVWQKIQHMFQYIGFYQRPVSAGIYIAILVLFFFLYLRTVHAAKSGQISSTQIWHIIALVVLVLVFSYPAFSYDMFNYMFTAKTVLIYHKNPYAVTPLAFSGVDPWLSFLHWTHLPSAYTPVWILLTLPVYLLGFGYFLMTLWNFKLLVAGFYLLSVLLIARIMRRVDPEKEGVSIAMFGLNPLVIIESLVSAHNDIAMMAFALLALFLMPKKKLAGWFALSLSVALKFMTVTLVPVFFLYRKKKFNIIRYSLGAMSFGLLLVLRQRDVLPWYLVWLLPFVALLPHNEWLYTLSVGASLGLLLSYAPFLYFGNWNNPVPRMELWGMIVPITIAVLLVLSQQFRRSGRPGTPVSP